MFKSKLLSQLDFIEHSFFGRQGGVSSGNFKSLNSSYRVGDEVQNVDDNRKIIADKFKVTTEQILSLKQVHETNIFHVDNENLRFSDTNELQYDGLITMYPGLVLAIYSADCIPILFVDRKSKLIAAIHCGWRGLINGIIENTFKTFASLANANLDLCVVFGPCIHVESYEVDEEFYNRFLAINTSNSNYFKYTKNSKKYYFNLLDYGYNIVRGHNVEESSIEIINYDTVKESELFFSHRRSQKLGHSSRGLQLSCIMKK